VNFRLLVVLFGLLALAGTKFKALAQSRIKSVPFVYVPEASEDRYNQRLKHKTLAINETDFVILSKKADSEYAIERYDANINKVWTSAILLNPGEEIEAFSKTNDLVYVLTHRSDKNVGSQILSAQVVDLKSGRKLEQKKIFEAPSKSRRIGVSVSEDGSKIAAFQYLMQEDRIKAISASVYDARLQKLKDRIYNLRDISTNFSVGLKLDNQGNQYLTILSDDNTKLSVRRYTNNSEEAKAMSVQLGGVFGGRKVYVFELQYFLTQEGLLYAAATCLDQGTAEYQSLKVVKFDFTAGEMAFAPEFKFTPEYLTSLNKFYPDGKPVNRLEDIALSQLILTPEKDLIIIAEKKYMEGGENSNYVAKELHLFTYDEYLNLAWRSVVMKNQVAPSDEGFSGISYLASYHDGALNILTLETLKGKTDLYSRTINPKNGAGEVIVPLGLNVANDKAVAYIKDFTAWLGPKTLIAVSRPTKKSATLQLNRISLK
jgi:hypothetical protein